MSAERWGRFTAHGSQQVEQAIADIVGRIAEAAQRVLHGTPFRALILFGGYGRGEGGCELDANGERPHNDLDFLLITPGPPERGNGLKAALDGEIRPIGREFGIEVELGTISERSLRRAPCRVMWYEMRFGHKTILGDAGFVPALRHFAVEKIPPSDVRNLLVNRGSLLLINELLLERGGSSLQDRRTVVRHGMKAVIGYGDALLFFHGQYHWSYLEKQRRMRALTGVSPEVRALYEAATDFRFAPRYADYVDRDLGAWNTELLEKLQPVHLECESMRLGRTLAGWRAYADTALSRVPFERAFDLRVAARKARNLLAAPALRMTSGVMGRLGVRMAGPEGVLPIVFPLVAYSAAGSAQAAHAGAVLGVAEGSRPALIRAYLGQWGLYGDPNFPQIHDDFTMALSGAGAGG